MWKCSGSGGVAGVEVWREWRFSGSGGVAGVEV